MPSYESGSFRWEWTAHFEPFVSRFDLGDRPRATPVSRYRFVVRGSRREGRAAVPYTVVSRVFEVNPWSGIAVRDLRAENDGRVSLRIGPRTRREAKGGGGPDIADEIGPIDYPDSYKSPAAFIRDEKEFLRDPDAPADPDKLEWFCVQCSWRPWLDEGDAETVDLTFVGPGGTHRVAAVRRGDRWVSERSLRRGEAAYVGSGCAQDAYGNYNRAPSAVVGRDGVAATVACATQSASPRRRCATPRGRLAGRRIGPVAIGRTRARNRRAFPAFTRPRRTIDRFCFSDRRHLRIGYPSRAFLRRLPRSERRRVRGRAIFMTTSSSRYRAFGARHGTRARRLRGRRYRVGINVWVLRRKPRATVVFKVRAGKVREVGLLDRRLTARRIPARRLLKSFD